MKPFPTELQNTINPEPSGRHTSVEFQRNLFCSHYDDCLDEAVRKGWNSFTCIRCQHYTAASAGAATSKAGAKSAKQPTAGGSIEVYATQRRLV